MKTLFFILLTFLSLNAFPGDKGNVGEEIGSSSLDSVILRILEIEDKLYSPLVRKQLLVTGEEITVKNVDVLTNKELMKKFALTISDLLSSGDEEMLALLTYENELFYSALGTVDLKLDILTDDRIHPIEREAVLSSVEDLFGSFWKDVKVLLIKNHGEAKVQDFLNKIDSSKLGYSLN